MNQDHLNILGKNALFLGFAEDELSAALDCLAPTIKDFARDEVIFSLDDAITTFGIVLSGTVHVEQNDYWGNRRILTVLGPAEMFAEAFCFAKTEHLPVDVYAARSTTAIFFDHNRILGHWEGSCSYHQRLTQNLVAILAQKNVGLVQKVETLTRRTTREKLLTFFSARARQQNSNSFTISLNRQELADYLAVDRSAMSTELSRMQKDGLITFKKNKFILKELGNI